MTPLTLFSTLVIYPLTSQSALSAKHRWLILNIILLVATLLITRSLTGFHWRRLALIALLSLPLRSNFLFGQYYVLLLFLLTLACWLYVCGTRFFAGMIVGLAAGLKIFPILYLFYFLRKRDLKVFAGGVAGALVSGAISIYVFGWELNRTYLLQVMPSALRGEASDPYNLQAASLSSLLHRLFIYEPQLNQHPAISAPWLFAVLHPVLQMALIGPALVFAMPNDRSPHNLRLEWAAILIFSLAVSTSSTSYLFTLLILPVSLLWASLQDEVKPFWVAILFSLYLLAGFVGGANNRGEGWFALLGVPRLYVIIRLCVFTYAALIRQELNRNATRDRLARSMALGTILIFSIASNLRHQQTLYVDYQWRIPIPKEVFMAVHPTVEEDAALFVAMRDNGYHVAVEGVDATKVGNTGDDELGIAAANGDRWVEQTGHESKIVSVPEVRTTIRQAESPVASFDGRWLAFLREDHGRARIWRRALDRSDDIDKPMTPPELDVLEMSFLPGGGLIFSAVSKDRPGLFVADRNGGIRSLEMGETRYPSVSPNGSWLTYSQLQGGTWNLWLRNLRSGETRRLTEAACNSTEPAWAADSQTLIYASDCARALWFSALCRRRIVY
ncbi:glycosyltransferase 87 family protein [Tunturiibacter psychrotolerans]